ncbi:PAN domain-containing protein [Rhizobium sp. BK176]|uniref:PAN domain-containing protein n=1 Tax=Rhizobium sp. BK176 TaxID=2587071 RepID=UPI0021694336|nr:PAN domain-containing protein [Rhizobium sp. BK176]MCS4089910.1 hypothetical protein [Rhizobium sp. BK176]
MKHRGHLRRLATGAIASSFSLTKISAALFLVCLFTASIAAAQTRPDGNFFDYAATLLNGDVSAEVQFPPADCRKLCVDRRGCVGYDYFHTTNVCRMFSSVASAREDRHGVAATRSLISSYHPPLNMPAQPAVTQQQPVQPLPRSSVTTTPGADRIIARYRAYIGDSDLYNSRGDRLTKPWQIIRQDLANFHQFGFRDRGDQSDGLFSDPINREDLEAMVRNGSISASAARMIVIGNVWVNVNVHDSVGRGRWLDVRVPN